MDKQIAKLVSIQTQLVLRAHSSGTQEDATMAHEFSVVLAEIVNPLIIAAEQAKLVKPFCGVVRVKA